MMSPQAIGFPVSDEPEISSQTYTVEASNGLGSSSWEKVADVVALSTERTATVMERPDERRLCELELAGG